MRCGGDLTGATGLTRLQSQNSRKTRSYCGPCAPLALLIYQTQKQSWIVKTGFQATFCAAGLPQPDPRRNEPEESSGGGKGFRKNFECQFHVRFPQRARGTSEMCQQQEWRLRGIERRKSSVHQPIGASYRRSTWKDLAVISHTSLMQW
jgi:hypothetical protein